MFSLLILSVCSTVGNLNGNFRTGTNRGMSGSDQFKILSRQRRHTTVPVETKCCLMRSSTSTGAESKIPRDCIQLPED
ncbi:hypothetical protein CapIbe_005534 [Capra ibex]